jgi:hypothetical protein
MADEHYEFAVTVPAGTAKATPIVTDISTPARRVDKIQWLLPPGASGTTGFRLSSGGVQVVPVNRGAFMVRDGTIDGAELARLHNSGKWDVTAYNTGTFPHTIYISMYVSIIVPAPVIHTPFGLDELQPHLASDLVHPVKGTP